MLTPFWRYPKAVYKTSLDIERTPQLIGSILQISETETSESGSGQSGGVCSAVFQINDICWSKDDDQPSEDEGGREVPDNGGEPEGDEGKNKNNQEQPKETTEVAIYYTLAGWSDILETHQDICPVSTALMLYVQPSCPVMIFYREQKETETSYLPPAYQGNVTIYSVAENHAKIYQWKSFFIPSLLDSKPSISQEILQEFNTLYSFLTLVEPEQKLLSLISKEKEKLGSALESGKIKGLCPEIKIAYGAIVTFAKLDENNIWYVTPSTAINIWCNDKSYKDAIIEHFAGVIGTSASGNAFKSEGILKIGTLVKGSYKTAMNKDVGSALSSYYITSAFSKGVLCFYLYNIELRGFKQLRQEQISMGLSGLISCIKSSNNDVSGCIDKAVASLMMGHIWEGNFPNAEKIFTAFFKCGANSIMKSGAKGLITDKVFTYYHLLNTVIESKTTLKYYAICDMSMHILEIFSSNNSNTSTSDFFYKTLQIGNNLAIISVIELEKFTAAISLTATPEHIIELAFIEIGINLIKIGTVNYCNW